jgi:isocitrate dehydrogenase
LLLSGVMMLEYMGWTAAADLINAAYPKVIADKTVTYDFARQMEGATEVSTSGFGDCLINKINEYAAALRLEEERRRVAMEEERKAREAERVADPVQAMLDSGRIPHTVADIMSRIVLVKGSDPVNVALDRMREESVDAVLVEPGADKDNDWSIMTQRDVVKKIINANRSPARVRVDEIATRPLVMVPLDMSLHEASGRMVDNNIRRLVLEQGGVPIGIVSDTSLFHTVQVFGWGPEI